MNVPLLPGEANNARNPRQRFVRATDGPPRDPTLPEGAPIFYPHFTRPGLAGEPAVPPGPPCTAPTRGAAAERGTPKLV